MLIFFPSSANAWSSLVSALPGKNSVVTVFVPGQEKPRKQSDKPVGIQIITGNEKLFKCQLCNEVFKRAQSFSGHCRLHRSKKSDMFFYRLQWQIQCFISFIYNS